MDHNKLENSERDGNTRPPDLPLEKPPIAGRNINLRYADDTTLMAESEEELKSLLMKVKKESEKFA